MEETSSSAGGADSTRVYNPPWSPGGRGPPPKQQPSLPELLPCPQPPIDPNDVLEANKQLPVKDPPVSHEKVNEYIKYYKGVCEAARDAYNIHAVHLKNRNDFITFPLLVITSATGVIASLDLDKKFGIIVGASSAVLAAVQRYCSYAERSENARMTAKSHSKIIRKIDNMKLIMDTTRGSTFLKIMTEIQNEIDSTHENAKDIPWELLKYIESIDATVGFCSVKGISPFTRVNIS